jgi:hypothetical protein
MWQVEVMLHNFEKVGIKMDNVHILFAKNENEPAGIYRYDEAAALQTRYGCKVAWYEDTRPVIHYISSIRPNIIKQHFQAYPELEREVIFYHDCDIVFTKTPDFSQFVNDNVWYLSDTNSYINSTYIKSKGDDVYDLMTEIVGIHPSIPVKNDLNSGGAQYILKNLNYNYWNKVELDSQELFRKVSLHEGGKKQMNPTYHELQIWCADMWAVLWNGWLMGNETKCIPELDFAWATDPIAKWDKVQIFHNAGVVGSNTGHFYKGIHQSEPPYNLNLDINNNTCSYKYYQEIKETEINSCII